MSDIGDSFQDLVRNFGDRVDIHTHVCVEWKLNHETCEGCVSELGCAKAVAMFGVSLTPMMYEPKNYADFEAMHESVQLKLDKLLQAKTIEEIQTVRW